MSHNIYLKPIHSNNHQSFENYEKKDQPNAIFIVFITCDLGPPKRFMEIRAVGEGGGGGGMSSWSGNLGRRGVKKFCHLSEGCGFFLE